MATSRPEPAPDVARVSLIHGDVTMQRGDSGDWVAATINTPLLRGDQVATGDKSQTEVQLDFANILRLSSQSQAKIADLTRTRIQVQLSEGYAYYSVLKGSEADVEIDTPNVAVRPLKPGRYRVQVNSAAETDVIVRDGEAELSTPQGSTTLKKGERATIRGTDNPEYKVDNAPGSDDWDRFNRDRDDAIRDAQSYHHTNPYYTDSSDWILQRALGLCAGVWQRLAALQPDGSVGALSGRPLGMGALLWMDVGFLRTLGLGAVPLRALVLLEQRVGMVAGTGVSALSSAVVACVRYVHWFWQAQRFRLRIWIDWLDTVRAV